MTMFALRGELNTEVDHCVVVVLHAYLNVVLFIYFPQAGFVCFSFVLWSCCRINYCVSDRRYSIR